MEHFSLFGIDLHDFLRAFIVFIAGYFGTKHGTQNGNGTNGK